MWRGTIEQLFIAPEAGAPMQSVEAVRAVPDRGLEGDRYFAGIGSFSRWPGSHRALTLIAQEALDELTDATGLILPAAESRRNVLTRGVPLNDLIGHRFFLGEVEVEGVRLCQPCKYLVRLTEMPGLLPGLVNRGGLRARILSEGTLRVGVAVTPATDRPATPPHLP